MRVLGQLGAGWFLSPPLPKPGLFPRWQQPGLLLLDRSPSGTLLPGHPASTGSPPEPLLPAEMIAGSQGPLLDSLRAPLSSTVPGVFPVLAPLPGLPQAPGIGVGWDPI